VHQGKSKLDKDDRFLFPGSSCFPLTPCGNEKVKSEKTSEKELEEKNIISENDQLLKIIGIIG